MDEPETKLERWLRDNSHLDRRPRPRKRLSWWHWPLLAIANAAVLAMLGAIVWRIVGLLRA